MPRLVLLPGLNGSSGLFAPLLEHLNPALDVQTLSLPDQGEQDFRSLADRLADQLGETPFVLLGESFSGPLAYRLALDNPTGLRGVIFAASFLRRPHPLLGLARRAPLPKWLLRQSCLLRLFCVGGPASAALIELLRQEINALPQALLRARMATLSQLHAPARRLELPALHLLPSQDRLVTHKASASLQAHCSQLQQVAIDGPHFLLQSQPRACARAIERFIATLETK
ncbi:alpha/beta fold hydrolase [Pseudomonas sp.]|uniref:alpha/beta fold hydrolase n=1 Tax=Pseudomonas sp. TaxID=306 RepID=UPI00299E638A|nr:alpha/beta fold hydrolase [Pseudomonas sp.]MDX1369181.1 alpha/beta fold hydrolase [Pseudomonas sp.]